MAHRSRRLFVDASEADGAEEERAKQPPLIFRLRTAVCSAGRAESLVLQGRIVIAVHRAFVSGCEGSSIAELCSVVSRVARETLQ